MNIVGITVRLSLLLILTAGCHAGMRTGQPFTAATEARRIVAAQASSDAGVTVARTEVDLVPDRILLEPTPDSAAGLALYRATVKGFSHAAPYLVGLRADTVWRLGGFPSPELIAFSRLLPSLRRDAPFVLDRAYQLARWADPNGAAEVVASQAEDYSDQASVAAVHWRQRIPVHWPRDTVVLGSEQSGNWVVKLTVLSRSEWTGLGAIWLPIAYHFVFDDRGVLIAWSRRTGEGFSLQRSGG